MHDFSLFSWKNARKQAKMPNFSLFESLFFRFWEKTKQKNVFFSMKWRKTAKKIKNKWIIWGNKPVLWEFSQSEPKK